MHALVIVLAHAVLLDSAEGLEPPPSPPAEASRVRFETPRLIEHRILVIDSAEHRQPCAGPVSRGAPCAVRVAPGRTSFLAFGERVFAGEVTVGAGEEAVVTFVEPGKNQAAFVTMWVGYGMLAAGLVVCLPLVFEGPDSRTRSDALLSTIILSPIGAVVGITANIVWGVSETGPYFETNPGVQLQGLGVAPVPGGAFSSATFTF